MTGHKDPSAKNGWAGYDFLVAWGLQPVYSSPARRRTQEAEGDGLLNR